MYFPRVAVLSEGRVHRLGAPADVLTYETIRAVYGTDVYIARNEVTGALNILPLSRPYRGQSRRDHPATVDRASPASPGHRPG
jgi:iron complex transport system ATP-binding protein